MTFRNTFRTRIQSSNARATWEVKRAKRVRDALSWKGGTQENPRKYLVAILPNGLEVYFVKPGKEAKRMIPNPQDMLPVVGNLNVKLKFEDVWRYLSRISVADFDDFRIALTLIYRSAYFLDHVVRKDDRVRYEPSQEIATYIDDIDRKARGVSPIGLMGLLSFLGILGWNEDTKYHVENNEPTFSSKYNPNVGRINTLLTCIRVPYQASLFVIHCIEKANDVKTIDFSLLYTMMQQFAKSRGTCTPTHRQLVEWLSPYVERKGSANP